MAIVLCELFGRREVLLFVLLFVFVVVVVVNSHSSAKHPVIMVIEITRLILF